MIDGHDLSAVKIVDLSENVGRHATSALADFGASVIHIGRPRGHSNTPQRALLPLGRNKRSILLDLKDPRGQEVAYRLLEDADVVVEGFRPGVVARLGIDYESVSRRNSQVIYCSLSGYGQGGPLRDMPGHDLNYAGVNGSLVFNSDDEPTMPTANWADRGAGQALESAILLGLLIRALHGTGQFLDVALMDGTMTVPLSEVDAGPGIGRLPTGGFSASYQPLPAMLSGHYCWYGLYRCGDGRWITVACIESWFWKALCEQVGDQDWIGDQYGRPERQMEMRGALARAFSRYPCDHWVEVGLAHNIPIARVNHASEVEADPQVADRGSLVRVTLPGGREGLQLAPMFKASLTRTTTWRSMAIAGGDTVEVLEGLGYGEASISELLRAGVAEALGPEELRL